MRRPLPALAVVVALAAFAEPSAAQDPAEIARSFLEAEQRAFAHFEREEWDAAIAAFEAQIAVFADNPRPYYNIACAYARQGNAARAATWLRLAIARGWRDAEHLAQDSDFAAVRDTEAFRDCVAHLADVRRADPDPMPRRLAPDAVSLASSVRVILTASFLQERSVRRAQVLLGEHDYRRRLFEAYDRRMAMLSRYLMENGDAPDADEAAKGRVDTATLYLEEADEDRAADRKLVDLASRYVLATAEDFLRGYPGSPELAHVLLLRAHALRRLRRAEDAEKALHVIVADHPDSDDALRARFQLCTLLADAGRRDALRAEFAALRELGKHNASVAATLDGPDLFKARLLAEGLPETATDELMPDPDRGGTYVIAFVGIGSPASERRLAALRTVDLLDARLHVVTVDPGGGASEARTRAWLAKHAADTRTLTGAGRAIRALGLHRVPTVIVVDDFGAVLAVDPTDAELARVLRRGRG
jgi:hypothetical protein